MDGTLLVLCHTCCFSEHDNGTRLGQLWPDTSFFASPDVSPLALALQTAVNCLYGMFVEANYSEL